MKVLLVSLSNRGGGAARAVDSLAKALIKNKYDVEVLTYEGSQAGYPITILNNSRFEMFAFRIKNKLANWFMSLFHNPSHDYRSMNVFPANRLLKLINSSDADIVNFHWYGAEMLRIEQIPQINKPIVWTLHDAWMANGVYHVSPLDYQPHQNENGNNWLDRWVYARKKKVYAKVPIHFITPSQWITDRFIKGALRKEGDTSTVIRNLIDTDVWKPIEKSEAKRTLGFSEGKTHVLFIANNILTSFNKGFMFVKQLLDMCDDEYEFHFMGSTDRIELPHVIMHGRTADPKELALYYSASDICLIPSLSENLPYVAVESLCCGTPILCFDTTGLSEIVQNGVNGYKAKKFDVVDLFNGLQVLKNADYRGSINESIKDYLPSANYNRYIEELKKIINECSNA